MYELPKDLKRPRLLTDAEFEEILIGEGPGNREDVIKAAAGKLTHEEADRMQKAIDEAFGQVDE